jgi:NADPH:quinone reductase
MRVVAIARFGGPDVLEVRERPTPAPCRGEVLVRVRAAAVNRADLLQRLGRYPAPADAPADVPGIEFAGEVEALGPGVDEWQIGERVFGLAGGGAYAEQLLAHSRTLARIPSRLTFVQAAAVPEAFITAFDAMVTQGRLSCGETALINAVASGVGTAAIQIARAVGARSIGTSRTISKLERARELGLGDAVCPDSGRFASKVLSATGQRGVDLVLELVGGSYVAEDLACMAPGGRIVLVGLLDGDSGQLNLGTILRKRIVLCGTVLRSRPLEEKIAVAQAFARHVVPLFEAGTLQPVVDCTFGLAEAAAAHAHMASNGTIGKIVLEVS